MTVLTFHFQNKGIILLELLMTLLLIEIGIIGVLNLFLNTCRICFDFQTSLQALELLRGQMERLTEVEFDAIINFEKSLTSDIILNLNVRNEDPDGDGVIEYKVLTGEISWISYNGGERCYKLVTFRHRP